jgi:hypothetical protein
MAAVPAHDSAMTQRSMWIRPQPPTDGQGPDNVKPCICGHHINIVLRTASSFDILPTDSGMLTCNSHPPISRAQDAKVRSIVAPPLQFTQ